MSRKITEEEERLFRETLKDATQLEKRPRVALKPAPPERVEIARKPTIPRGLEAHAPAIGGHRAAQARRGKLQLEARIDLHGFSQDEAYAELLRFLGRAQASGKRVVLVVTGKGQILRAQLPLWLGQDDLRDMVSGMSEAHVEHGGSGAFYVTLRGTGKKRR